MKTRAYKLQTDDKIKLPSIVLQALDLTQGDKVIYSTDPLKDMGKPVYMYKVGE